jgi:hypothetical protein
MTGVPTDRASAATFPNVSGLVEGMTVAAAPARKAGTFCQGRAGRIATSGRAAARARHSVTDREDE